MAIIHPIIPPIVSGFIYNVSAQTVPVETDVIFDTNDILTPGITHAPGTTQIAITNPGNYEVTFSVSGVEPGCRGNSSDIGRGHTSKRKRFYCNQKIKLVQFNVQ
ncbi:MAG: flagellar hook-length control protein FliK [Paenibacillus sp.]|jgi:hypothetical protein|nr:flagellar hook-length control protein FliK [Paenibacillus sp.]